MLETHTFSLDVHTSCLTDCFMLWLLVTRCPECVCSFHLVLPEVLLLVSGEVHQVPQQKRLHHGELRVIVQLLSPHTHALTFPYDLSDLLH